MNTNKIITGIPFKQNRNLSNAEVEAVSYYRDMGEQNLHRWHYPIPSDRMKDKDCFMINEFLRGNIPKNKLVDSDKKELLRLIPNIHSAITQSFAPCRFNVYRGLGSDSWIEAKFDKYGRPIKNKDFVDYAFGSFSADQNSAIKYTNKNNSQKYYFLVQTLEFGDLALYIDNREYEWLLPPNTRYFFQNKEVIPLPNGGEQITYYIRRYNK